MQAAAQSTGKQTPVSQGFQAARERRTVESPRHGRKSKHENDLKREEQIQAYTLWVNSQLKKRPDSRVVQDLPRDLKDGVALIQLIEVVAGEQLKLHENPTSLSEKKENVDQVLHFMSVNNIKMHQTASKEILEGNLKSSMRLILALAAHFKPGSVKQSAQNTPGSLTVAGKRVARTPSAAAAASEAAAAIAEASRAAASVGRHINSRYRKQRDPPGTPPRSPMRVSDGTPLLPTGGSLVSTPKTSSHSSKEGRKSGRSSPGSGSSTPKGRFNHDRQDISEHSGSDVDSGLMCSRKKPKATRTLTNEFLNELGVEQDALVEDLTETKKSILYLQKLLLDGRVEEDEVPEECSYLEATDPKEQLTIVNARLGQLSEEYDVLKSERNNFKEEAVNLQGIKSGLTSRLSLQEEAIMQLKSELLKSSFMLQNRNAEIVELQRKLDERDNETASIRGELLRRERVIDRQRAEFEDTLRDMEHMKYAEAATSRQYHDKDVQIHELKQRIVDLQDKLQKVVAKEADITSRIHHQDQRMKSFEEKVLNPTAELNISRTDEMERARETIRSLRECFRPGDLQQHTLDVLEQIFGNLTMLQNGVGSSNKTGQVNGVEYSESLGYVRPVHSGNVAPRLVASDNSGLTTKVLYFTEQTVTPFLATIPKRLGNITLRDFKTIFGQSGQYRYHFKALDPEFGTVKEEVIDDQDTIPGWEGKIVAWVEEDRGLLSLNHHDNSDYDFNMNRQ